MTPAAVADVLRRSRLTPQRRQEIFGATLTVLSDAGYDRMTMDAVAHQASASKATLYRHWHTKADLVVDAVRHARGEDGLQAPDTGSLRDDLRAVLRHAGGTEDDAQVCMMRSMVSACGRDEDLAQAFQERLVDAKRGSVLTVLQRAQVRGEVDPTVDVELLVDVAPAMLVFRHLLTTHPVDDDYADRLVDEVWLPLLTRRP
jgi:AcrR family transcriptional regulator